MLNFGLFFWDGSDEWRASGLRSPLRKIVESNAGLVGQRSETDLLRKEISFATAATGIALMGRFDKRATTLDFYLNWKNTSARTSMIVMDIGSGNVGEGEHKYTMQPGVMPRGWCAWRKAGYDSGIIMRVYHFRASITTAVRPDLAVPFSK